MRNREVVIVALALASLSACAGPTRTPEEIRQDTQRLLQPFLVDRAVGCSELEIDASGHFFHNVGNPGVDKRLQGFERTVVDGVVQKVWTNLGGSQEGWFTVTVGPAADPTDVRKTTGPRTKFTVTHQFRLRIHERSEPRLDANAVEAIEIVAGEQRKVGTFVIGDGMVRSR